jgi:hypothetical protein
MMRAAFALFSSSQSTQLSTPLLSVAHVHKEVNVLGPPARLTPRRARGYRAMGCQYPKSSPSQTPFATLSPYARRHS